MNRCSHRFLGLLFFCLVAVEMNGQECGQCKQMPRVANYDLEVAVPKLADTGEAMLQWRMLFWLGRHANNYVFHQNKDCVRFTQPVYSDGKENETLIIGATHAMLPPAGDISNFGDYILTGFV